VVPGTRKLPNDYDGPFDLIEASDMLERSRKRPRDTRLLAEFILDLASGRRGDSPEQPEENPAAVLLGRLGGLKGGMARADSLSAKQRRAIAQKATILERFELQGAYSTPLTACGRSRRRSRRVRRTRPSRRAEIRLPRATPNIRPACSFVLPSRSAC
jgi:uncharacterized protein YciW